MAAVEGDLDATEKLVAMEFRRMFANPADPNNCFIDIQAGAGGTEACDWARCCCASTSSTASARVSRRNCWSRPTATWPASSSASLKVRRRLRLRLPAHRNRRAPPGAQIALRFLRRAPHQLRQPVRLSRDRRQHRGRDQPGRPAHRHLPRLGRRRPAHQQDRLGGAHHPRADRHRRAVPERPLAAPQPRRSDGDAEVAPLRARDAQAPGRGSRSWRTPRPTSAGATRSAATCSTSRASRICAPTSKSATRRRCSTATSTPSSRPASSRAFNHTEHHHEREPAAPHQTKTAWSPNAGKSLPPGEPAARPSPTTFRARTSPASSTNSTAASRARNSRRRRSGSRSPAASCSSA
jgi:hypothetical protein